MNVYVCVWMYECFIADHHGAMGAPQASIVSYDAVQGIQRTPGPATLQRAPKGARLGYILGL